jgi:hypothetical protein
MIEQFVVASTFQLHLTTFVADPLSISRGVFGNDITEEERA